MKKFQHFLSKNGVMVILSLMVILYVSFFSVFTILRIRALWSHYFDLGIMHQAVYNTYMAIRQLDWSRVLEISNPHGTGFVKRMAVHNDILLAFLSPFYFIFSGPETLVVLQSIVLGLGAFAVFGIAGEVFKRSGYKNMLGLIFSFAYLMYVPMQRANMFDFHAVTFATTFLLYLYYFWLKKRYCISFLFLILSLLTKEQIGLTTFLLGLFLLFLNRSHLREGFKKHEIIFPLSVSALSIAWFLLSVFLIIPYFRGSEHFALVRYPVLSDPGSFFKFMFHNDSYRYLINLLGPLAYLSLLSPLHLAVAGFEFAVNLLSNSWNMRSIIYHYTSVIQPFVFLSAIYGARNLISITGWISKKKKAEYFRKTAQLLPLVLSILMLYSSLYFAYTRGSLPFAKDSSGQVFPPVNGGLGFIKAWSLRLKDESISVSSTGHLAPFFTSRRRYYHFTDEYEPADYVVVQTSEVYNYFDKEVDIKGMYERLRSDGRFALVEGREGIEVYKKISR